MFVLYALSRSRVLLREMLGTRYGPVGSRFSLIPGTRFSILETQIGSLKRLNKTLDLVFVTNLKISKFTKRYICFTTYCVKEAWAKGKLLSGGVMEKMLRTTGIDSLMLLFTKCKCTWLTTISMSLSRCITCQDVCVQQSHTAKPRLPLIQSEPFADLLPC